MLVAFFGIESERCGTCASLNGARADPDDDDEATRLDGRVVDEDDTAEAADDAGLSSRRIPAI